jgi:hypothetical protein
MTHIILRFVVGLAFGFALSAVSKAIERRRARARIRAAEYAEAEARARLLLLWVIHNAMYSHPTTRKWVQCAAEIAREKKKKEYVQ